MKSPFEHIFVQSRHEVPPVFQDQFLFSSDDPHLIILEGEMQHVWHRPKWLKPLFWLMGKLSIFIPYTGENIPTKVTIQSGKNNLGQPTHSFDRHLEFPNPYDFNTVMLFDPERDELAEKLGWKQILYMAWQGNLSKPDEFSFQTKSVALKFGDKKIWLPRWVWICLGEVLFTQKALSENTTSINLVVKHPLLGDFFGYQGIFEVKKVL
jgi:hypothetical protein